MPSEFDQHATPEDANPLAQRLFGDPAEASALAHKIFGGGKPRSIEDELRVKDSRNKAALVGSLAQRRDPDEEARVQRVSQRLGVPPDAVRGMVEEFEKKSKETQVDPGLLYDTDPVLAKFITKRPGVADDDISELRSLSWALKVPGQALEQGVAQVELGKIGQKQIEGTATPADLARADKIEREILSRYLGDETLLQTFFVEAWKMVPQLTGATEYAASAAASAFVLGKLVPGPFDELFSMPSAAIAGTMLWTYQQEGGLAFRELDAIRNPRTGERLDPEHVRFAAIATGAVNGILESLQLGRFMKQIPGARQFLSNLMERRLRQHITSRTMTRAAARYGLSTGTSMGVEGFTEFGQELSMVTSAAIVKQVDAGEWDPEDWQANFERAFEAGVIGAGATMFLGGATGSLSLYADVRTARKARNHRARLELQTGHVRKSKLFKRSPELGEEAVKDQLDAAPQAAKNIYIPVEAWDAALEKAELDPEKTANDIIGEGAYQQAKREGGQGDIVIPVERYLSKVSLTELHEAIADDTRSDPDGFSMNQMREARKELENDLQEAVKVVSDLKAGELPELTPAQQTIFEREEAAILGAKGDADAARIQGLVHALMVTRRAERAGVDPVAHHEKYELALHSQSALSATEAGVRAGVETEAGRSVRVVQGAVSPLGLTEEEMSTREVAAGIQALDQTAIAEAAEDMTGQIPEGTRRLVPVPDDDGDTSASLALARAVSKKTGVPVADILVELREEETRAEGEPSDREPGEQRAEEGERAGERGGRDAESGVGAAIDGALVDAGEVTTVVGVKVRGKLSTGEVYVIENTAEGREAYHRLLVEIRDLHPSGAALTLSSPDELTGATLMLSADGSSGVMITAEGDLGALFSHPTKSKRGDGLRVMAAALKHVAEADPAVARTITLDSFETKLPELYAPLGVRAVARIPWDESQAPPGWDKAAFAKYNNGEPSVVFYVYDPETEGSTWTPEVAALVPTLPTWDEAVALRKRVTAALGAQQAIRDDPNVVLIDGTRRSGRRLAAARRRLPRAQYLTYVQEQIVLNQSTALRATEKGRREIRKWGLDPKKKPTKRQLARALEKRQEELFGLTDRREFGDPTVRKFAKWMAAEVRFALQQPKDSAVGWYTEKYQAALDIAAGEFPELADQNVFKGTALPGLALVKNVKGARDLMTAIMGIVSNGQSVTSNFPIGLQVWKKFRETGQLTAVKIGARRGGTAAKKFRTLQDLLEDLGPTKMHAYLLEPVTVKDMKAAARAAGENDSSGMPVDMDLPRASILLGPKIGIFYANLMGKDKYLTMDLWWSRMINRYRGDLQPVTTPESLDRFRELSEQPDITDAEVLLQATPISREFQKSQWANSTPLKRIAHTIDKNARTGLRDDPDGPGDRDFMMKVVERAQSNLSRSGIKLSIADIQAVQWYYEKRLYAELGVGATDDVSFEDVAADAVYEVRHGKAAAKKRKKARKLARRAGSAGPLAGDDVTRGPDGGSFTSAGSNPLQDVDYVDQQVSEDAREEAQQVVLAQGSAFTGDVARPVVSVELDREPGERARFTTDPDAMNYRLLDAGGFEIGVVSFTIEESGELFRIHWISAEQGLAGGVGALGIPGLRKLRSQIKKDFPNVKRVSGQRISGGRLAAAKTSLDVFGVDVETTLRQDERAEIRFRLGGRKFDITQFETRDPSSLFHEVAHMHLEVLRQLATAPDATAEIKTDFTEVMTFLGLKPGDEITDDHHEKFANAFEQYLREGIAPTEELRGIFSVIKGWMVEVYGAVRELVQLTPEIRSVFDRMLASDQQIKAAQQELNLSPIPAVAEAMTPDQRGEYIAAQEAAKTEGDDALRTKLLDEEQRIEEWFATKKAGIEAEVEKEFASTPKMRAIHFLQKGRMIGSEDTAPELQTDRGPGKKNVGVRLSRAIVLERYGQETLAALPKDPYVYTSVTDRAIDPDELAPFLGFRNGTELVEALKGAPRYDDALAEATQRRMDARFGDMMKDPNRLARESLDAVQGDKRIEQLILEVRWMQRTLRPRRGTNRARPFNPAELKDAANRTVNAVGLARLKPWVYQRNAQKHGRLAFEAMERGNIAKAFDEKSLQIWNMVLYRATRDAQAESEGALTFFRRMQKGPAQAVLGKAGRDYQDAVNGLLEKFELRTTTGVGLQRRINLRQWIQEKRDAGEEVIVDPTLDDKAKKHYRELTVSEMRELRDGVKNIFGLAKLKTELQTSEGNRDFAKTIDQLVESAIENVHSSGKFPADAGKRGQRGRGLGKVTGMFASIDASLLRMESVIVDILDGGDTNGIWSQTIFQPIAEAQKRSQDMMRDIVLKVQAALTKLPAARRREIMTQNVMLETAGETISKEAMLLVAFNWGNDSNRSKLVRGGIGLKRWGDDVIAEILNGLSREDWILVQDMWDVIGSMWPQIEALERELTGVAPPRVLPTPFVREFSEGEPLELAGGYFPMIYSPTASLRISTEANANQVLFDHRYVRAMTAHGHTSDRIEGFADTVDTSLDAIPRHLSQVVHDLTHRKAVLQVHKILTNERIKQVLRDRLGAEKYDRMVKWNERIANDSVVSGDDHTMMRIMRALRTNFTYYVMGWKATTSLQNFANIFNVLQPRKGVKPGAFAKASKDFITDWAATAAFVNDASQEMAHRFQNLDRDIRAAMEESLLGFADKNALQRGLTIIKGTAFRPIVWTDAAIAYPTWLAAFREKSDAGKTRKQSVAHADSVIRRTMSSGAAKDIASVQAGGEGMKWMTMFYTFFSGLYGRHRILAHDVRTSARDRHLARNLPGHAMELMMISLLPILTAEFLSGRAPSFDDDPEDWWEWAKYEAMFFPAAMIPLLREVANGLEGALIKKRRSIQYGPLGSVGDQQIRSWAKIVGGDAEAEEVAKALMESVGTLAGIPPAQSVITLSYWYDVAFNDENIDDIGEFLRNSAFRRTKEKKATRVR